MKQRSGALRTLMIAVLAMLMLLLPAFAAQAATYSFPYPSAPTKKGLYVCPGMEEDALELGIRHTTINLSVGDFMPDAIYRNKTHCVPYVYEGTTYWFSKASLELYDNELGILAKNNVLVTAILLLPNRTDNLKYLISPAARGKSANYYQWNMNDPKAVRALKAIVTFFQKRYSNRNGARIVGWIVGNEVNNSRTWNWAGYVSADTYMDQYAAQVAEVYHAARSVYSNARIYISLDHYWAASNGSYWYAGKDILKKFASRMKKKGLSGGKWCIAYHPYNISQYEPNIMSNSASVTNKASTRIITMKNLKVLTKYVKKHYSKKCRIILSEQGYSSVTAGSDTSKEQARNIALAYYIAQQNSMVDALILHRQVDHTGEGERYGLYTSWGGENAAWQKPSWTAYKYADTTRKNKYTKYAAKKAKKLSGKKVKKIYKVSKGKLTRTGVPSWSLGYADHFTPFGALTDFLLEDGVCYLKHDYARNPNVPWGVNRRGVIRGKKYKKFGFGIRVSGSLSGSAIVYLRLWSGTRKYLDASAKIHCGVDNYLSVSLSKWKARKKITRVEILIRPNKTGWKKNTSARIFSVGIGK